MSGRGRVEAEHSRLAEIVRSSHDAIVSIDAELRIRSWNSGAEAMYGYCAEEVMGKSSDLLVPPDATLESRGLREQMTAGGAVHRYETKRLRKDGTLIEVAITGFPLRDAAGDVYGAASIARDITAHNQAVRSLAESEARYREILDETPDGVWRVDAENRTDYVNARMASMLGYTVEEMTGRELSDFMDPESLSFTGEEMAKARRDGHPGAVEHCWARKDGTPLWTRVSHVALTDRNGDHSGALAIMSDITASKAQAVELHASEHFLAALTDSMAEGMFAMNRDGQVTYMNDAAEKMLGWTKDELTGRSMHDATHYQHADGSPHTAADSHCCARCAQARPSGSRTMTSRVAAGGCCRSPTARHRSSSMSTPGSSSSSATSALAGLRSSAGNGSSRPSPGWARSGTHSITTASCCTPSRSSICKAATSSGMSYSCGWSIATA